jgi:hypothetical protein
MSILNRAAHAAALVLLAVALATCGDDEPAQRKAFIEFLQDINGRAGVHFLNPTPKDEQDFGPYLQHYSIILDYNKDMKAASEEFANHIMKLGIGPMSTARTIERMVAAPQDLATAKEELERIEQSFETRLAKVITERGALKQPDDLKAVYDKTFDRLITTPSLAFEKSVNALVAGIDVSIKLVDYVNSHRSKLAVTGMNVQAKDQRTLDEVGALIKAHQAAGEHFAAAQRDGDRILRGD